MRVMTCGLDPGQVVKGKGQALRYDLSPAQQRPVQAPPHLVHQPGLQLDEPDTAHSKIIGWDAHPLQAPPAAIASQPQPG